MAVVTLSTKGCKFGASASGSAPIRWCTRYSFFDFIFFALCLVAYLFAAYGRGGLPTSDELFPLLPLLALMVILAAIIGTSYRTKLKKLPLIRDGQFVAVRVVERRVIHRSKQTYNQITYEFQESHGPLVRKTERDHSRLIFEDMLIPVFYNPTRPSECVALCATYYRLPDAEN